MIANEDFLFTQEAIALGFVTDAQVKEAFELQKRMSEDLKLDERVSVILVKRGYMGEDQARRVYAKIEPKKGGTGEIQGYRLLEVVGRGAMGTVYRAIHLGLKREVALKILRQDLAADHTQVERLRAEAAMLASLDHPNIVRALDAGESNGFPYVAMEFVEGETLRDLLRREGALSEEEALRIARALADALEKARRQGVVHRDVKPGNVLMAKNGTPKLMDFGLAKGPVDLGLTQHGATVGTPQYIAPEQAIDPRKADTRSDIYALGATLYAMLTGRPPFDGQTLAEILTKVLYETPTPVRAVRPEISLETGYLVERMMLRDPSLRYRTPAMFVHDIDRLSHGASILPTGFSGNWEAYLLRKRVRRTLVRGAAAAVLIGGGWFTLSTIQGSREREQQTTSLEKEIGGLLDADRPTLSDPLGTVVQRLNRAQELSTRAEELHPPSERALAQRVRELAEEQRRFRALADTERQASAAEQHGEEAAADALFEKLLADPALVTGPARSAAMAAREKLGERSDEALRAEGRKSLGVPATSLATLHTIVAAWRETVATRFAATPVRSVALRKATEASDAARLLASDAREALDRVSREKIAERVTAGQFVELRGDLETAAKRLADAMRDWKPPLLALGGPSEAQIWALVQGPLIVARETAAKKVSEELERVVESATTLFKKGDSARALEMLAGFSNAARDAYPEASQRASDLHTAIDTQSREAREATAKALEEVVAAFLGDLRAYDLARASARLSEAAARPDVDLRAALEELGGYPAAYEQFYARALKGLAAHVGPERAKWLEPVALRDGSFGRFWEIRAVSPDTKTFVVASHSGGAVGGVLQTHDVRELADEEIWRLGGVGVQTPEDLVLRALRGLATWPDADPDFYVRKAALQGVVAAFERAGLGRGALATWTAARLEDVNREATDAEKNARASLASAKELLARALYSQANYHFGQLKYELLRFTQVARDNALYIDDQLKRIRGELKLDEIANFIVASIQRVGGGDPEQPIVTVHIDFDTKEELANFTTGVGRLERSSVAPVVTPDRPVENLRLLLLPDDPATVVKDQPLGMRSFLDATSERWISFVYSSMTPVFLGIDLDGVQVGIVSADPAGYAFPHDVPPLEGERKPPSLNYYGRGRGVMFRTWSPKPGDKNAFGDPSAWPWDKDVQGRHVLAPRRPEVLEKRLFAFEANRQYRVKLVHQPEQGRVALLVDDREVISETSERWKKVVPSGRLQILTFTTCAVDDLTISGRISAEWLAEMKGKSEKRSTSGTHEVVPPKSPK